MSEYSLTVEEASFGEIGRHIARLHRGIMELLHLAEGDCVEIKGATVTGAILGSGLKSRKSQDMIQIDARIRKNAWVVLGQEVVVSKTASTPALSVTLAPDTELRPPPFAGVSEVRQFLLQSRPVVFYEGDLLAIKLENKPKGAIPYLVTHTDPIDVVTLVDSTELRIGSPTYIH